jgi:Fic family protein
MLKLTKRQQGILDYIREKKQVGNKDILEFISQKFGEVTRFTIIRDIDELVESKIIRRAGSGRNVVYEEAAAERILKFFDIEDYFNKPPDRRSIIERFNFDIFKEIDNIFTEGETQNLEAMTAVYRSRYKKLSMPILKRENERLMIELSWKSSHIEGNTYNLVETEYLIRERREAVGHSKEEAIMILNHRAALDHIREKKDAFKKISYRKIADVHHLLTKDLGIARSVRKGLVGITGTRFRPLDNEYQIREALDSMFLLVNKQKDVFSRALLLNVLIAYIQAFEDGNKRTSRLMGNAALMAHGACPLSFRSIDEMEYKKAMLLFCEQNSLRYFKELFIEQYEFAVRTYFL